jgi:hypothetical protein
MSAIPVIKTRNIKSVKCMSALNPQERSPRMPLTGCKKRFPHKILLKLADIMDENLSMNQRNIEDTVSIRPSFLFIISNFFTQSSDLSVLKSYLPNLSQYPYSLT